MTKWLPVPDFEDLYEVSSEGQIRRVTKSSNNRYPAGHILKANPNPNGYLLVCLSRDGKNKWMYLHSLVCTAFHGPRPSPKMQCCHENGDRLDCRESNLRWDTRKANELDKIKHGTHNRGERHGLAKLTDDQVIEIKEALLAGRSQRSLAKKYGVSQTTIYSIKVGKRWLSVGRTMPAHLDGNIEDILETA